MISRTKAAFIMLFTGAILFAVGCGSPNTHPNELNAFDGSTFDSLVATDAALTSLRAQVSQQFPAYKNTFNTAASGFNMAVQVYTTYRSAPNTQTQAEINTDILSLTQAVVALETQIQSDLHVDPTKVASIRASIEKKKGAYLKAHAAGTNISIVDVLTELDIAATVAEAVPGASPYAALAQVVIQMAQTAITAVQASNGTPIDLTKLPVVALLS